MLAYLHVDSEMKPSVYRASFLVGYCRNAVWLWILHRQVNPNQSPVQRLILEPESGTKANIGTRTWYQG